MSNIDLSMIRPAAKVQAEQDAKALEAVKLECQRRIFAVASRNTQINLASASSAGLLNEAQQGAWVAALGWVVAMRAACPVLAESRADFTDDTVWPQLPEGVAELTAQF